VAARVTVTGEGSRYHLDFEAESDGVKSRRRLVVDSCEAVTEAAALLLLLTMDPILARALGVEEPTSTPDDATLPSEPPPDEPSAEPVEKATPAKASPVSNVTSEVDSVDEPNRRNPPPRIAGGDSGWRGWVGVGPEFVQGMTPAAALGPAVSAGLGYGVLRLSGSAGWHRAWTANLEGLEDGSVEAELVRAGAGVGVQFGTSGVQLGPVVGVGFERVTARTFGISAPGEGSTSWPTLRGGVGLNALISTPWSLSAEVGALLPLSRPSFLVEGEPRAAHQPAKVGAEVLVAISWAWGSQF
jgi:hypothetical protein